MLRAPAFAAPPQFQAPLDLLWHILANTRHSTRGADPVGCGDARDVGAAPGDAPYDRSTNGALSKVRPPPRRRGPMSAVPTQTSTKIHPFTRGLVSRVKWHRQTRRGHSPGPKPCARMWHASVPPPNLVLTLASKLATRGGLGTTRAPLS